MDVLICYDQDDHTVGHFVEMCANRTTEIFDDIGMSHVLLGSKELESNKVSEIANRNGNSSFICAAYSHGSDSSLINKTLNNEYISTTINQTDFQNVFFYTWACSSAQELGPCLRENGCSVYIGHLDPVSIPPPGDEMLDLFVDCAVFGLQCFYDEGVTAVEALNMMRDLYDKKFDELIYSDPLAAGYLQEHSNSLDICGIENLTYKQMIEEKT